MTGAQPLGVLTTELASKGFSPDQVDDFLRFLQVPEDLDAFLPVVANLSEILPLVVDFLEPNALSLGATDVLNRLDSWIGISEYLQGEGTALAALFGVKETCSRSKRPTCPIPSHPLYVMLWHTPASESVTRNYQLLQAAVIAATLLLPDSSVAGIHGNAIAGACRVVRQLAASGKEGIVASYPDWPMSLGEFRQALGRLLDPHKKHIIVLLKYSLGERECGTHRVKQRVVRKDLPGRFRPLVRREQERLADDDDEEDGEGTKPAVPCAYLQPSLGEKEERHALEMGCCAEEFYSGREYYAFPPLERSLAGEAAMQEAMERKNAVTRISKENQRLPVRWETISPYDVMWFLISVRSLYREGSQSPYAGSNVHPLELAAVLSAMFWLGCPQDDLGKLTLYLSDRENEDRYGFLFDIRSSSPGAWVASPARPSAAQSLSREGRQFTHASRRNLLLPYPDSDPIVAKYVMDSFGSSPDEGEKLFRGGKWTYQKDVSDFLSLVNSKHGTRLTATRISRHLFEEISNQEGSDLAIAMLITGYHHSLGMSHINYTTVRHEILVDIYRRSTGRIMALVNEEMRHISRPRGSKYTPFVPSAWQPTSGGVPYVGSRYCPTGESVRLMVDRLRHEFANAGLISDPLQRLLHIHNSMTIYTVMMIAYATGFRAIRDPFLHETQIDRESGFAVISDKDDETYLNARIVWIPPVCLRQLDLYNEHVEYLLDRLPRINYRLYREVRGFSECGRTPLLFFIDPQRRHVEVGPRALREMLSHCLPLPVNAGRHYLRSSLLERGCPHEVINAFMGHGERGEEAWGTSSGLSPVVYRRVLGSHLEHLLKDAGWKPEAGLRRRM